MTGEENKKAFFATMPGILLGAAAFIALLGVFLWFQSRPPSVEVPKEVNVAQTATLTSSHSSTAYPPALVIDGNLETSWNAEGSAPQSIDFELAQPAKIVRLHLVMNQDPAGNTRHLVLGRASTTGGYLLLHEFKGATADKGVLDFSPPTPWEGIRQIRIETAESPSWVSWREIEIYGTLK